MRIAIASGKGGTGKTTLATNLAFTIARQNKNVVYVDCDVEEPNGNLFLQPKIDKTITIGVPNPQVDQGKCDGCGECGEICRFSAIVVVSGKVLTFPELCHGCGACSLVCPLDAISEMERPVGILETGNAGNIVCISGRLNLREAMPVPLIKQVKNAIPKLETVIIDAPPGTSCPVIEAVKDSDYVVLVTEPTPFGLNDLKLAVDTVRELKIPFGVILNRADAEDDSVKRYCREEKIDLLAEIPHSRKAAEAYARGDMICEAIPEFESIFKEIAEKLVLQTSPN